MILRNTFSQIDSSFDEMPTKACKLGEAHLLSRASKHPLSARAISFSYTNTSISLCLVRQRAGTRARKTEKCFSQCLNMTIIREDLLTVPVPKTQLYLQTK